MITGAIIINEYPLTVKEYQNKRLVTFNDIDKIHKKPTGTARKRFNDNQERFIEGTDYYKIANKGNEHQSFIDVVNNIDGYRGIDYKGFIYIAKDNEQNCIKIGRTKNKKNRIVALNTGRVLPLNDFEWFDCLDILKAEKEIHKKLQIFNIRNEWFSCTIEQARNIILECIKEVNNNYKPREYYTHDKTNVNITQLGYLKLIKYLSEEELKETKELINNYFNFTDITTLLKNINKQLNSLDSIKNDLDDIETILENYLEIKSVNKLN